MPLVVQGVEIFLKDAGSGSATLFLHGNPDTANIWDGVTKHLETHYRCLAPDLPGFGRSSQPEEFDCSLDNLAQFIDQMVENIGITEPLNLVVHDIGGVFGLAWFVKHPEKVRRVVITNSIFSSDYRWHIWAKLWRTPLVGELSMLALIWPVFRWSLRLGSRKLTDEQMRQSFAYMTAPVKRTVLRLYRAFDPKIFDGWEDELKQLTASVPTLVLWGDRDPYIPPRYADVFGSQQIRHFPDCGHWLPAEASDDVPIPQLSLTIQGRCRQV